MKISPTEAVRRALRFDEDRKLILCLWAAERGWFSDEEETKQRTEGMKNGLSRD